MHGRKRRVEASELLNKIDVQREKVKKGQFLLNQLLQQRRLRIFTEDVLNTTYKLLQFYQELSPLWEYRREIISAFLEKGITERAEKFDERVLCQHGTTTINRYTSENRAPQTAQHVNNEHSKGIKILDEMKFTREMLVKCPKAYCVWLHRSWTVAQMIQFLLFGSELSKISCMASGEEDGKQSLKRSKDRLMYDKKHLKDSLQILETELSLCNELQNLCDGRNFHGWRHRTQIATWKSALELLEGKLDWKSETVEYGCEIPALFFRKECIIESVNLTSELIEKDFSNFSAWHLRTLVPGGPAPLHEELDWLWQGLYTEPADQSLWQYYDWLVFSSGILYPTVISVWGNSQWELEDFSNGKIDFRLCLYIFFSHDCSIDSSKSLVHIHTKEGQDEDSERKVIEGVWEPLSEFFTKQSAGFNRWIFSEFCCKLPLTRVWRFSCSPGISICNSRIELSLVHQDSSKQSTCRSIDMFHLNGLSVHTMPLFNFLITSLKQTKMDTARPPDIRLSIKAPNKCYKYAETDCDLSIFQWYIYPEVSNLNSAKDAVSERRKSNLTGCNLRHEVMSFDKQNALTPGTLAVGVTFDIARNELNRLSELLQLESDCIGASLAKVRLLSILNPEEFDEAENLCRQMKENDPCRRQLYDDLLGSIFIRTMDLRGCNIQRLAYPVLLGASDAQRLILDGCPISDSALRDWHVPFLPLLEQLDCQYTNLRNLFELLATVCELPNLKRINLSGSLIELPGGNYISEEGLERHRQMEHRLHESNIELIDVSSTPLAATVSNRYCPISEIFQFEKNCHQAFFIRKKTTETHVQI